jgi:hypothetical protein
MKHDPIVTGNADRISYIAGISQRECSLKNTQSTTGTQAMSINHVSSAAQTTVIDGVGERGGGAKIGAQVKAEILDQTKEPITMIVSINGGKIICPGVEIEVSRRRFCG